MIKIGIVALQGAITEHILAVKNALHDLNKDGKVIPIKTKFPAIDGLIIPGGESTTISHLLEKSGLFWEIQERASSLPIMGTCAGCILLAQQAKGIKTLGVMHMEVERNAFGRQKDSFQYPLKIHGFKESFPGIFIRAPVIRRVWNNCRPLASIDDKIVMAKEKHFLAVAFHPELAPDLRLHQYFLKML
jgi:5'-phosphate synthase pdxT subunit